MATVTVAPAHPRRIREMALMLMALALGIGGYVLTTLNRTGEVPVRLTEHIVILVAVAVIAEVGMHLLAPYADPVILPVAVALTGIGLAMIYRIDLSYQATGQPTVGLKQLVMVGIGVGLAALVLVLLRDHRVLGRFTYIFGLISLVLLLLPMIPGLGTEQLGARVWIRVGPISLQPGELVKITLAIFFAGYLVTNRDNLAIGGPKILGLRLPRARDLGPIVAVWLIGIAILVLQRDLGTSLLFFGLFVAMLYVATNRVSWLVIGLLMFAPAVWLAVRTFPHVQNRFTVWLHALDPTVYQAPVGSYQVVQGLFGQASGGLMGTGWGRGYPQLVPFAQSDFILSSLAEELGLTGLAAILVLYLILIQRGLRAAIGVRDGFGKLLATGLSFSLALQVFVVLGGITRLIPLTGLTAPFLASGGSSMVASWLTVALLVRISDAARRPAAVPAPWSTGIQAAVEAALPARLTRERPVRPAPAARPGVRPTVDEDGPAAGPGTEVPPPTPRPEDGPAAGPVVPPPTPRPKGSAVPGSGAAATGDLPADRRRPTAEDAREVGWSRGIDVDGPAPQGAGNADRVRVIDGDLPDDPRYPAEPDLSRAPEPAPPSGPEPAPRPGPEPAPRPGPEPAARPGPEGASGDAAGPGTPTDRPDRPDRPGEGDDR